MGAVEAGLETRYGERHDGLVNVDRHLIRPMISEEEIRATVHHLAEDIYRRYDGQRPVLVAVLNGARTFRDALADDLRTGDSATGRNPMVFDTDELHVSSYDGQVSTHSLTLRQDLARGISNRPVIVAEDIIDTGGTLAWIKNHLATKGPQSLAFCVLLDKFERREAEFADFAVDFRGFMIKNKFVVGYGLDCDGLFRELPFIGEYMGSASDWKNVLRYIASFLPFVSRRTDIGQAE